MLLLAVGLQGRVARVLEKAAVLVSDDGLAWIRRGGCSLPAGSGCAQAWFWLPSGAAVSLLWLLLLFCCGEAQPTGGPGAELGLLVVMADLGRGGEALGLGLLWLLGLVARLWWLAEEERGAAARERRGCCCHGLLRQWRERRRVGGD